MRKVALSEHITRLLEGQDTVADCLKHILDIGRQGDEQTQTEVIQIINGLKTDPKTRNDPAITAVPRGDAMFTYDPIKDARRRAKQQPAPGPELTSDGRQKLTPQQFQALMQRAGGDPNKIKPEMLDRVPAAPAKSPTVAQPAAPVTPPTPVQPTPATASTQPVQQAPEPPQPPQAPAAPAAPQSPVEPASPIAQELWNEIGPLLQQPTTNPEAVLNLIGTSLRNTQPRTPERQQLVTMMKAMQQNPDIVAKIPQLKQLNFMEGRNRSGSKLYEANDDLLKRSELDRIFVAAAQQMVHNAPRTPSNADTPSGSLRNANATSNLGQYYTSRISLQKFDFVAQHKQNLERKQVAAIRAALAKFPNEQTTVKKLLDQVLKDSRIKETDFEPKIVETMIEAAKKS